MAPIDRDALITELRRQAEVAAMAGASAPTITPGQALANLADSLEDGWLAPVEDVMAGAIDRLRAHLGTQFHTREVSLALNEAFRNGMRSVRPELPEPAEVRVQIPGLDEPTSTDGTWIAYRGTVGGNTTYRVEGDPNGLAVGRFKASLRRFLGVA